MDPRDASASKNMSKLKPARLKVFPAARNLLVHISICLSHCVLCIDGSIVADVLGVVSMSLLLI